MWIAYFVIHSALASDSIKEKFGKPNWFRGFYVVVSILLLLPIFYYRLQIPTQKLFEPNIATKIPSIGLGYVAYILFKQAASVYDMRAFLGLKAFENSEFKTHGILERVRHPFYTATIAIGAGFFMWTPTLTNLIMVGVWFAYLPFGIWFEEKKLVAEFGETYKTYQKSTPIIFPKLFK